MLFAVLVLGETLNGEQIGAALVSSCSSASGKTAEAAVSGVLDYPSHRKQGLTMFSGQKKANRNFQAIPRIGTIQRHQPTPVPCSLAVSNLPIGSGYVAFWETTVGSLSLAH